MFNMIQFTQYAIHNTRYAICKYRISVFGTLMTSACWCVSVLATEHRLQAGHLLQIKYSPYLAGIGTTSTKTPGDKSSIGG